MPPFILFLCGIFLSCVTIAQANTHLDLNVVINLDKSRLEINGSANAPFSLPATAQNIKKTKTTFKYHWPLPQPIQTTRWQGEAFANDQELYLPQGWHPKSTEFLTYELQVRAPFVIIASGEISNEAQADQNYQARFTMNQPVESIPLFGGPYQIEELVQGETRLRTYFYTEMAPISQGYLRRTAQYIKRFNRQIGPFPFPQFHIIAAPVPAGLGFSGLTYMGARVLQLPFIKESSLGHEILHNYWGNGVFPDYQTGNWAEGLTTYMADYLNAERQSGDKAKDMRLSWLRDFAALPKSEDKPVTAFKAKHSRASQVIGYHKVAFIFHMLRQRLGDAVFFQALRDFWNRFAFQTAGWKDLEAAFSKTSQQDLSPFFNQWLKSTGAPEIKSISAHVQHQKNQGWDLKVTVVQGNPTFKVQLPLSIGMGAGLIQKHVAIKGLISQASTFLENSPVALSVDPDFHLFRTLSPREAPPILRDVMLSKKVDLIILDKKPIFQASAVKLISRMIDTHVKVASKDHFPKNPFVMIGTQDAIDQHLKIWRLSYAPFALNPQGSSHIWAGRLGGGAPYIIISLKELSNITDLMRPLPHYGKRGGLIFKGGKVIFKSTQSPHPISALIQ